MSAERTRRWLRWGGLIAAAAVAVGGVAFGLSVAGGDDAESRQLASIETGCRQWMATGDTSVGDPSWCAAMTGWMADENDRADVGSGSMWSHHDQMLTTCRRWMADSAPTEDDPDAWCTSMVEWMADHLGEWARGDDWGGWMMGGGMMGSGGGMMRP